MRAPLLALLLLLPLAAAGYEEERLADYADATGWHTQKKMTRAPDGTLYYAYVAPAAANETDLVVVRVAPDGLEAELPRVRGARGDLSRPSLTLDAAGALHLAWTERAEEDREVFAARFAEGRWEGVTQLSAGDGYAGFPSLGADGAGRVHVAWYGFDGDFYQVFHRAWSEGRWGNATQMSSGPLDANNPSLVVDAEGGVHLAWYKDEGRRFSVWYAHRAPEGAWGLPQRLPEGEDDALNVALAVDRAGRVHAAWDEQAEGGFRVRHAVREAGAWSAPRVLAEPQTGGEYPAVAAYGDGVVVAWAGPRGLLTGATLVGAELVGSPAPLLSGVVARNPSLRGPAPFPEGDRAGALDLLWAQPSAAGLWEVRHVALREGCEEWPLGGRCALAPAPAQPAATRDAPAGRLLAPLALALALALAWPRRQSGR